MRSAIEIINNALVLSRCAEPKAIRRASCVVGRGDIGAFSADLAMMISSGVPFTKIAIPDRTSGIYHENQGVIVREIITYDLETDSHFVRYDAALKS